VNSLDSGQEPVTGCCELGDEPSISGASDLVNNNAVTCKL
jgi:hypothetical protein